MTNKVLHALAALTLLIAAPGLAAENAAAMVLRIEPADSGIAKVLRDGRSEDAAFMMSLYEGDQVVVESANTIVQVKIFGGDDVNVRRGEPLTIGAEAEERTIFGGMLSALSDKVFRNNQLSRRNLVTRSDGESPALLLHGFDAGGETGALVAGRRALILRWNLDLDSVDFRIEDIGTRRKIAGGRSDGDFAFVDAVAIEAGHDYRVLIESTGGLRASGSFTGVAARPVLTPVDATLGVVGDALQLVELAGLENGRWKFEAMQGVLDLSPDDIDRATLIEEISAL